MTSTKTQLLVVAALCASTTLGNVKHLDFCNKDKAYCEDKCSSSNGYLMEVGQKVNNLTHHHNNGGLHGYVCLLHKIQRCDSVDQCLTGACCSYSLLEENNKICLPKRLCNVQRREGESCLADSMCASNRCSSDGKCHSMTVTQKLNLAKNQESSGIHRRGFVEGSKTEKRNLQSFSTYTYAQYCPATKATYYSYSYFCSSDLSDLSTSISSSLGSLATGLSSMTGSSSSGTYTSQQYCAIYKSYYYSKSFYCPTSTSSQLDDTIGGALNAFGDGVSAAKSFLGAIIGGIVGGLVLIIILIVVCCYCCCKKKAPPAPQTPAQPVMQPVMQPGMMPMQGMYPQQQPQAIVINV